MLTAGPMIWNSRARWKEIVCAWLLLSLCAAGISAPASKPTTLQVKTFPLKGPLQKLQPQVLDFRYAPLRWQTCIGLPDDPHKSIVGSDGGLYYDYGSRYYDFGTRILASMETEGVKTQIKQSLRDPRIPIVITEQKTGNLTLRQEAWAGFPDSEGKTQWSRRVDYLWLKMTNTGSQPQTGRIVVQIDSQKRLLLDDSKSRLFEKDNPNKTFCFISPACSSFQPPDILDSNVSTLQIEADHSIGISEDWAHPNIACDERFRNAMVGYGRPLVFTYRCEANRKYRVAFGLIEGWYSEPNSRPLEIRIEGETSRSIDLAGQYGKNTPVVLIFDAKDENGSGTIEMGIYSPQHAADKNTILSSLWIFDANDTPTEKDILAGGLDNRALAVMYPGKMGNHIKLLFDQKQLAPGQEERVLISIYQGDQATAQTSEQQAGEEQARAVKYWRGVNLPYDRIIVPDPNVQALLDSCIRNIYQAREIKNGSPAFQVGPTCYRGTWAADGPFILEAVTYLGRADETRAGLEHQVDEDQGPGGVEFSKKSGLRLWMIWRHAQLTGDWNWLQKMWPRIEREVNQIIEYRQMTMNEPNQVNYGLMPIGFGDGGLGGKHREYTNVYWTLSGLKAAIDMATKLNKPQLTEWKIQYDDYWRYFQRARNRDKLTDSFGHTYVPVTMKGEEPQLPQRGAWAFLQSIFPGRIFDANDALMLGTMSMLDATEKEGLIYGTGWQADGIWNYAGSFYAHAHLWLGHGRKAAATLYAFGNHASPLLCWREEQNLKGQKGEYTGDMPHNWASAEFIRLVRHSMILERGNELHLLEGLPTSWTKAGCKTRLTQIPTSFGPVSVALEVAQTGESARLVCEPPQRDSVSRIVVHLENFDRPVRSVKLAGRLLDESPVEIPTDRPLTLDISIY